MKNVFIVCALLLYLVNKTHATNAMPITNKTGIIYGKVLDANLKQPLPYVNVIIKDANGKTITGGITLDDGTFEIDKIEEGNLQISIQYIGYKTFNKNIKLGKGNYKIDIGSIYLEEDVESLNEVTVIAEVSTIQQKVDRKK